MKENAKKQINQSDFSCLIKLLKGTGAPLLVVERLKGNVTPPVAAWRCKGVKLGAARAWFCAPLSP